MYKPDEFEKKWIDTWEAERTYTTPVRSEKPKSYVLGMFPYPSGEGLHTGHGRIFSAVDVIARYQRMKGFEVLMPMGWDAFGLPAENAAIKAHKNPVDMVPHNEANFKRQMMMLGLSYDWERSFSTTDPEYFKWTQWLFLKLYSIKNEKGERLVYRKEVAINWCPFCKTGLANEEVEADGTHERCGNKVVQKLMPQWNMRITDYSDRLLSDLDSFEWQDGDKKRIGLDWPDGILAMQRNWIGKKNGVEINFGININGVSEIKELAVFTTRVDTIFGVTFIVISPEKMNEWVSMGFPGSELVRKYIADSLSKSDEERTTNTEKTGVATGVIAINPISNEEIPVFVADYVVANVGTGAVMGVPAHDERDHDFAVRNGITVKYVVGKSEEIESLPTDVDHVFEQDGVLFNSGKYSGMKSDEAREAILLYLLEKGIGKRSSTYHLRDWVFSRQRYWGEPFPLVYCPNCGDENGVVPLPEEQLPLKLPYLESYEPTETGQSPLSRIKEWTETKCPNCGGEARRETDTMPNWAGSCWYFLRFTDSKNQSQAWSEKAIDDWMPVDWYLGGAEHAVLHLLYARFWTKAFYDLGLLKFNEPFLRLRSVGMVLAEDGKKMSKSLGNVVNPDDVVAEFGADAVRIYEMFMGPWDQAISWSKRSLVGCKRFVDKVWDLSLRDFENKWKESDKALNIELNRVVAKVGEDIGLLKFNTAVAALMKFMNSWGDCKTGLSLEDLNRLVLVIAPMAPFVSEELWHQLGNKGSVHLASWPKVGLINDLKTTIVVQVNGKTRGLLETEDLDNAKNQSRVEEWAAADANIGKWIEGREYSVVFVPSKLINFVISGE